MQFTVIKYYGKQNSRCGYCSKTKSSHVHGMHAYIMDTKDYQDLIDRGWRRSGEYCYKPNNKITCCPCYTIRSDTTEFKLSKSHKKILKRMNKFLRDGIKDKSDSNTTNEEAKKSDEILSTTGKEKSSVGDICIQSEPEAPNIPIRSINLNEIKEGKSESQTDLPLIDEKNVSSTSSSFPLESCNNIQKETKDTRPPCKKAKHIRMERRQAKLLAKGITEEQIETQTRLKKINQEKSLEDYINDVSETDRHKLEVILVPSHKGATVEVFNLYRKYQLSIHDDQPNRLTKAQFERFLVKSPLKIKLVAVRSDEFKATLNESYGLYEKYQTSIHNMPPEEGLEEYLYFLQKSPIKRTEIYGSFHQQYWLDGKLIAVGVIDILPNCVSSVYFFYDPEYSFLTLGTYGSLREIQFTQQLSQKFSSLKYYYMGFYIHSCPKMRYKGKISPSYLLCPETYVWTLLTDEVRQNLDNEKYQRFNRDPNGCDLNEFSESDLDEVLVLINGNSYITYRQYIQSFNIETLDNMLDMIRSRIYEEITGDDGDRNAILEYGKLVGKSCAHRMLYEQS